MNGVSINLYQHEIHALIGPNGAGKSSLINLLSGDIACTSGHIYLTENEEITHLGLSEISLKGVARSYQKTNIFESLSVWENIRLAAQSRERTSAANLLRWFQNADNNQLVNEYAESALEEVGLSNLAMRPAGLISHGEKRQLEIAMTLATQPRILLLDEPMAGMGAAESQLLAELLVRLKSKLAILLVEHDLDVVFALSDQMTVMVNGTVIANDKPSVIKDNSEVQRAYLGEPETQTDPSCLARFDANAVLT